VASTDSFFVTRTMRALEVLAFHPASAPQIAGVLRVDARTARRLLNRLADDGWLTRSEGRARTYTLSLRVVALAAHFAETAPVACAAQPAIRTLHEQTGGAAHLTVPSYRAVLCLVQRAGHWDARPHRRELVPAHASAGGKVLLGHREHWRESVLELPLEPVTERTIVDADALRADCAACVERGVACETGEYRPGLESIAAPVREPSGEVVAAVAVTAPADLEILDQADAVRAAAADVETRLAEHAA
jgi:DNA-binding IclR family transcriptional regulator